MRLLRRPLAGRAGARGARLGDRGALIAGGMGWRGAEWRVSKAEARSANMNYYLMAVNPFGPPLLHGDSR